MYTTRASVCLTRPEITSDTRNNQFSYGITRVFWPIKRVVVYAQVHRILNNVVPKRERCVFTTWYMRYTRTSAIYYVIRRQLYSNKIYKDSEFG